MKSAETKTGVSQPGDALLISRCLQQPVWNGSKKKGKTASPVVSRSGSQEAAAQADVWWGLCHRLASIVRGGVQASGLTSR